MTGIVKQFDSRAALRTALNTVTATLPAADGGKPYLRLLKDGEWVFGKDDVVVRPGTKAVVDVKSAKVGYACWTDRSLLNKSNSNNSNSGKARLKDVRLGEVMANVLKGEPVPREADLPKLIDPETGEPAQWKLQASFVVKLLDGENAGQPLVWKTSSYNGLLSASELSRQIAARADEGDGAVFPVIEIRSVAAKNSYGRFYKPDLRIVGWMTEEEAYGDHDNGDEPDSDPESDEEFAETLASDDVSEEPAPMFRSRRAAAVQPVPQPATRTAVEAPSRRRRTF